MILSHLVYRKIELVSKPESVIDGGNGMPGWEKTDRYLHAHQVLLFCATEITIFPLAFPLP